MRNGDFLKIDYVGRIAATGEVFDLTDEAVARKEGIHDSKQDYAPQLVILGSGMTVPGVEKQLLSMKPGEKREFDVDQAEGFGRRDPRLIKIISLQKFYSQKINPVPGAIVNIDGRHARIQSVSGGRVRVDFNSPLAGRDLRYSVTLVRVITATAERAQAMLDHYGLKAKALVKADNLTIQTAEKLPDQVKNVLNMQVKKWIKEVKKIVYVTPSKKKPASETTPKGTSKPPAKGESK